MDVNVNSLQIQTTTILNYKKTILFDHHSKILFVKNFKLTPLHPINPLDIMKKIRSCSTFFFIPTTCVIQSVVALIGDS